MAPRRQENINILNFLRGMKGYLSRNQVAVILINICTRRLPVNTRSNGKQRTADIEQMVHMVKKQLSSAPTESELQKVGAAGHHLAAVEDASVKGWGLKSRGGRQRPTQKESAALVPQLATAFKGVPALFGADQASAVPAHGHESVMEVVGSELDRVRQPWKAVDLKLKLPKGFSDAGVRPQTLRALASDVLVPHFQAAAAKAFVTVVEGGLGSVTPGEAELILVGMAMKELQPDEAANMRLLENEVRRQHTHFWLLHAAPCCGCGGRVLTAAHPLWRAPADRVLTAENRVLTAENRVLTAENRSAHPLWRTPAAAVATECSQLHTPCGESLP